MRTQDPGLCRDSPACYEKQELRTPQTVPRLQEQKTRMQDSMRIQDLAYRDDPALRL